MLRLRLQQVEIRLEEHEFTVVEGLVSTLFYFFGHGIQNYFSVGNLLAGVGVESLLTTNHAFEEGVHLLELLLNLKFGEFPKNGRNRVIDGRSLQLLNQQTLSLEQL